MEYETPTVRIPVLILPIPLRMANSAARPADLSPLDWPVWSVKIVFYEHPTAEEKTKRGPKGKRYTEDEILKVLKEVK